MLVKEAKGQVTIASVDVLVLRGDDQTMQARLMFVVR